MRQSKRVALAALAGLALRVGCDWSFALPEPSGFARRPSSEFAFGGSSSGLQARSLRASRRVSKLDLPSFKEQQLKDAARNVVIIGAMAATIAGSWFFTGKWWKVPLYLALPSMCWRLWTTRGDTTKLAQVSASVDSKYVASTEEAQAELHMFMCSGCGYTLFPARGREVAFFTDSFKCPMCGASKDEFVDMNDDDDDGSAAEAAAAKRTGKGS
mmetsp:Transcript_69327/g.122752  ORF Transcript_69327/g.122752 Transcript_69327/m.122752 type:complete len:214 (+) Transcript_69327:118-759(+)